MSVWKTKPANGFGASWKVTGDLTPDATGFYFIDEPHNGRDTYFRADNAFAMWHDGAENWIVSVAPDDVAGGCWTSDNEWRPGLYEPTEPYLGDATLHKVPRAGWHPGPVAVTVKAADRMEIRKPKWHGRRPHIPHARARVALGMVAKQWQAMNDAHKLIWQGVGKKALQIRSGLYTVACGFKRYVQCNMARAKLGLDPISTLEAFDPIAVSHINFYFADTEHQLLFVAVYFTAQIGDNIKATIHVSQVAPAAVGTSWGARFAAMAETQEISWEPVGSLPIFWAYPYKAKYKFRLGDQVGLLIRIVLHTNPNPPITDQDSVETTEDWSSLIRAAE